MGSQIRALVASADDRLRSHIVDLLVRHHVEVAHQVASAEWAVVSAAAESIDVAILDERLPDMGGVELCREIRSRFPEVQCLMFTAYSYDETMVDAIMAGASGYLLKHTAGEDLLESIRVVAGGSTLIDPAMAENIRIYL